MLCHRLFNFGNRLRVRCAAFVAIICSFISPVFCQQAFDFSNQGSLDLDTPQRFKPVVGLEMGGIWLGRSANKPQDLVFDGTGNLLLDSSQLQGKMGAGLDSTLNLFNFFSDQNAIDVQMRFFQAGDMQAHQTITATQVSPHFFSGVPAIPSNSYDINYETRIRSFESNLVARTPYRIRFLAGFRFFEVDEIYDVIDNPNTSSSLRIGFFSKAENTMAGGQLGAEGTLLSNGHSRVFGSFKWALLANDMVGSARASTAAGAPLQADARDSITSQLLDFQLGSSLSLSRTLSFYAGYQGLMASDIALALEQNKNASIFTNSNPVYTADTQWHGFKITGMATW